MGATVGNAAATAGLPQVLNTLAGMGVNTQALLGGVAGGGAAATPGAGAAATPGAAANAASTTNAGIQMVQAPTARGTQVTVTKDPTTGKYSLTPPTGLDEKVLVDGKNLLFDAKGVNVRNFEVVARQPIKVDLDQRVGIASGISNLSRIVAQRQERLKGLQEALAQDSNESGNTNQLDIQQLVQEQQVSEHISNLNHKIYESVQNAIGPWLR
jgi:hypothetical protein